VSIGRAKVAESSKLWVEPGDPGLAEIRFHEDAGFREKEWDTEKNMGCC
jgi:hypothetical protein